MASLYEYTRQVQRFLRDGNQKLIDFGDIIEYVNQARREVAMRAQCVRVLPPISGSITSASITNPGINYTAPTATITSPDSPGGLALNPNGLQASITLGHSGGSITSYSITQMGSGYFQPSVIVNDPTGSGATITPNLSPIMLANTYQEQYQFSAIPLNTFPGVASVYAVLSYSLLYAQGRYSALFYSFSQYQAWIRQYGPGNYYYVPCFGVQYGRGVGGSFMLYPPPSQPLQMELDCVCLPSDLATDTDVEAIPEPWNDAVPYWAAHLAFLEIQNHNVARLYKDLFDERMKNFGAYSLPGRAISMYGRP